MAEVIVLRPGQPPPESIPDFIRRKGAVTTLEVAYRFGFGMKLALHELAELRDQGQVVSSPAPYKDRAGTVRMHEWRIATDDTMTK